MTGHASLCLTETLPQSTAKPWSQDTHSSTQGVGLGHDHLEYREFQRKMQGSKREERNSLTDTYAVDPLLETSNRRPKHNPPCTVAVDGHAEGNNNEGEVDDPSANVGNGEQKCGDNCGSSKVRRNMDEME